jgi:hypothetical protein
LSSEPVLSPRIVSNIPSLLKATLREAFCGDCRKGRRSVLISSNSLANKFIHLQWGIRPSQRRQFRNLFLAVREQCRTIFQYYIKREELFIQEQGREQRCRVYKFDEVRGNLILGFVYIDTNLPFIVNWTNLDTRVTSSQKRHWDLLCEASSCVCVTSDMSHSSGVYKLLHVLSNRYLRDVQLCHKIIQL